MSFRPPFKPTFKSVSKTLEVESSVGVSSLAKAPKSPIPDANPFRVGLEHNPVLPPPPAGAEHYYGNALKFAQNASGVAINVAQDEVKEKVTVAVLGKAVATTVGVVAIPFAAADLFDSLAPGVKAWLMGGWKGAEGKGQPTRTVPGLPGVGQCPVSYEVKCFARIYDTRDGSLQSSAFTYFAGQVGPLSGPTGSIRDGQFVVSLYDGSGKEYSSPRFAVDPSAPWNLYTIEGITVKRQDGEADSCISPPLTGQPSETVANPKPSESRYGGRPTPPPQSGNLPSTQRLSDLFNSPRNNPSPAPSSNNPESPNPSSQTKAKPDALPAEYDYREPPENPTPPLEEQGSCDPCQIAIGRKLDELRKKLDKKPDKKEENEETACETYPFEYSYGICSKDGFRIEPRTLILAEKPTPALRNEFDSMLALAAQGCAAEPVAAIPDWWQVRVGADRPQIVVAFRKADTRTYHQIALPHPVSTIKWTENNLGDYQKGPWSGILTLKDNSKFIINCSSKAEAQRMVAMAKALIRPDMQFSPSAEQYTERKGNAVGVATMRGRQAYYFSTGQRDAKPDWRAQFD